jgi:phosphoribosylaminoimidazolecarboxamide formyltransferase/IMP cyclohydrolase
MNKIKRAIISVCDKTGVVDLAKFLVDNDIEVISTGGTKKTLETAGIPVLSVSSLTNQKEIMDGRVKTIHPNLFGGILADRTNKNHMDDLNIINSKLIDLVVINLYPFIEEAVEKKLKLEKSIEYIDIGGPSMLRASAKNYKNVIPICSPNQYEIFMDQYIENNGLFSDEKRIGYAKIVFELTMKYDYAINQYFINNEKSKESILLSDNFLMSLSKETTLRYGENPHQESSYYLPGGQTNLWNKIQGKKLSYNNYLDMESASSIAYGFDSLCCVIIKHSNPCGFGFGENNLEAYNNAVSTDPISYFGGIVAFNLEVGIEEATKMTGAFLECIIAPSFTKDAINIFSSKKNLRIIELDKNKISINSNNISIKSVFNGYLFQEKDKIIKKDFEVVTDRKPTEKEMKALLLGWEIVRYVKSNAIVINNSKKLLGIGAGQMSRVDSVKIAIRKSKENDLNLVNSIMASDAFFPFSDSLEIASKEGIEGIIQPGGSIKDKEVIDFANKNNLFMVFTGERHFLH